MASEISKSRFAALLTPDLRLDKDSIWAAQSSYTQQSPTAGVPEPQGNYELVIESAGTQTTGSELQLLCRKPGLPGDVGVVWRNVGDDDYRGWNPPYTMSYWEAIEWTDGTTSPQSTQSCDYPHALALASGKLAVAYKRVPLSGLNSVRVQVKDAAGAWTSATVVSGDSSQDWRPTLVEVEDRLLCFVWSEDTDTDTAQIKMYFSEDDGASWDTGSIACLPEAISTDSSTGYTLGHISAAYANGQILLVGHLNRNAASGTYVDVLVQYASVDLGASFTRVFLGSSGAGTQGGFPEVIVYNGKFHLYYLAEGTSANSILLAELGSAFTPYTSAAIVDIQDSTLIALDVFTLDGGSPDNIIAGDLSVCADANGGIWVLARLTEANDDCIAIYSGDGGATWDFCGQSSTSTHYGFWFFSDSSADYLVKFSAAYHQGRLAVAHQWVASTGNEDGSIGIAYLGGYSTVTLPPFSDSYKIPQRVSWDTTWIPFETPFDLSGYSSSGTGTATLTAGYMSIVTTVGQTKQWSQTPAGTVAGGMIARIRITVSSAPVSLPLSADYIALRMRVADGSDDYDVSIRFATDSFRCYDNNAASAIGSDVSADLTGGVDILAAIDDGNFSVWYRVAPDNSSDHQWIEGPSSTSLTNDSGSPDANHIIRFGHQTAGASTSLWHEAHFVADNSAGLTGLGDFSLPDGVNTSTLYAKPVSSSYDFLADGVSVRAVAGPGFINDEFLINTRYRYPIENIFHGVAASPRVGWRSVDDTADETIAIRLSSETSVEQSPGNDVIGFGFFGCNWRTATIYGRNSGGSWVEIGNVDSATGLSSLRFQGYSSAVEPSSAAGSTPYVHTNEFEGCTFRAASDSDLYRITGNTEGKWSTAGQKSPTLFLATPVGSSSGTAGAIWATNFVHLIWLNGAKYSAYRIVIDAQDTVDGDLRIGTLIVGYLNVFGTDYSWGRTITTEAGAELTIARDRTSQSRVVAPPARAWEFAWTDGIDQSQVEDDVNSPDWIEASDTVGADAVASTQDTAYQIEGLVAQLDGAHTPVVYIPRFDRDTEDDMQITLTRRKQLILSRIISPARIEVIQGDELLDEVVRVATVEGQEVV